MIWDFFSAIVLGLVEGLTEFLPVSSTGHLILFNEWFKFGEEFTHAFDIFIQLGAISAVVIIFWKNLFPIKKIEKGFILDKDILKTWQKIIIAVLPIMILGYFFGSHIQDKLFNYQVVSWALIIGGIALIMSQKYINITNIHNINDLSYTKSLFIGLFQCLALIPGISRAASTIVGGIGLGLGKKTIVEFSFFMAIPTLFAASVYSLFKANLVFGLYEYLLLSIGFITAFIVAIFVIKYFLKYIQSNDFRIFGYYRIILGILVLLYFGFK
jgi:undecaprenyl-diphosphatase